MMSENYKPEEYGSILKAGDYEVMIKSVEEKTSRNGNAMLEFVLSLKEASFDLKYWIVDNEYKNQKLTKFFDCFSIPRGNFEYNKWKGCMGFAHIDKGDENENGKSFFEIQYLIVGNPKATKAVKESGHSYVNQEDKSTFEDDILF